MLMQHPEVHAELQDEQRRMVPDEEALNYHNLLDMDAMRRCITESLRLYPPLILLMRQVMTDGFKVGEHTIPKGDVVGLRARVEPRPALLVEPLKFDPGRYLPGRDASDMFDPRSVGHGARQGFMLSFGGSAHMCSGGASATCRSRRSGRSCCATSR